MSSPTPPGTPRPASKWASKMGAAVRRSSTMLSFGRPATPSSEPDSDSKSLRRSTSREVPQTPPPPVQSPPAAAASNGTQSPPAVRVATPAATPASMPTPISESPAREEAAMKADIIGPSPLARIDTEPTTISEPAGEADTGAEAAKPATGSEPVVAGPDSATSPVGYVPPPVIDSTIGNPGAFTDVPEELPRPTEAVDPYAESSTPAKPPPPAATEEPVLVAEPESILAPTEAEAPPAEEAASAPVEAERADVSNPPPANPGAFTDTLDELPKPTVASESAREVEAPAMEHTASYFDKPMAESMLEYEPEAEAEDIPHAPEPERAVSSEFIEAVESNAAIAAVAATAATAAAAGKEEEAPKDAAAQAEKVEPKMESKPEDEADYGHGEAASYYRGDFHNSAPAPVAATEPQHAPEQEAAPASIPTFVPVAVVPVSKDTYDSTITYGLPEYESHEVWSSIKRKQDVEEPVTMVGDSWVPAIPIAHAQEPETAKVTVQDDAHEHAGNGEAGPSMPVPFPATAEDAAGDAHGNGAIHSDHSSFKMPNPHPVTDSNEDPFADPIIPIVAVPLVEDIYRTQVEEPHAPAERAIIMPLPAFNDVAPAGSIRQVPSQSTYGGGKVNLETDERIPLLGRPTGPNKGLDAFLQSSHAVTPNNYASVSPLASTSHWQRNAHQSNGHAHSAHRLHELGWLEYALPDGSVYYVHPTRKITTDAGLRVDYVLDAIEVWCERHADETRDVGVECWLREMDAKEAAKKVKAAAASAKGRSAASKGKAKKGETPPVFFERYWVDHHARTVFKAEDDERKVVGYGRGHANGHSTHGKGKQSSHASQLGKFEDDELDQEYRFWSFMEAHPAHTALPHKAKNEALDILQWAWTDQLLPSVRPIQPPFTQEECQELSNLLRSFNNDAEDHGIQTRVVARVLLRVAHWRQTFFRPNKPLPKDVGGLAGHMPLQRRTVSRAIFDLVISALCLGIPYIFLQRATRLSTRMDEESGLLRGPGPMVVIGAATCLVAAIVLSASVTLLSLPGLDSIARTTGMVAVVFAAFAMAATGVAVLRHKADMERPLSRMNGVEGLMIISRRSVAMSLPLVLLSYAVIAFVTAIVIYSFRGSPSKLPGGRDSFHDYMKWTVVGVVGALAGILTTSMIVLGR